MEKGEGRYVREGGVARQLRWVEKRSEGERQKEGGREESVSAWTQWGYYLCMWERQGMYICAHTLSCIWVCVRVCVSAFERN